MNRYLTFIWQRVLRISCPPVIVATLFAVASAETRVWVDDQGREVRAAFSGLSEDGVSVNLKLENGTQLPFPLARLSGDCRAYASEMAAAASKPGAPQYHFDGEWPDLIGFREDPEIEIISEDAERGEFIYESRNFRFVCDVRLSRSVVRGFSLLFEATHAYCKAMPIGMGEGDRTDGKYLIKLFEKIEDYFKAGAPQESAGVFMGSLKLIMVPLDSLGVRPVGSGYMLDRDVSNRILAHEIAHQLTPPSYFGDSQFNSWFIEGIAEYVAITPYRSGRYNTRTGRRQAVEYATGFSRVDNRGRNIGTDIKLTSLQAFMEMPYSTFVGANGNFNYAVGLLLTYYFIHFDGEGDAANLKAYKQALLAGKDEKEATGILLAGRTYAELERDVEAGWRRHGLKFIFGK